MAFRGSLAGPLGVRRKGPSGTQDGRGGLPKAGSAGPERRAPNACQRPPEDAARIAAAAATLLPKPERNNDKAVIWGWRRHGIRVVTELAIALEDPEVRSPCSYFGKLAVQERGAADLRLKLAQILRQKNGVPSAPIEEEMTPAAEPPPLMFAPGSKDDPWPEISSALRRLVRGGAYGSWFNRSGFHRGLRTTSSACPRRPGSQRIGSKRTVCPRPSWPLRKPASSSNASY